MSNNLRSLEKRLRSFIKRSKEIKYTKSLLFTFLIIKKIVLQNIQPCWIKIILMIFFKWQIKIMIEFPDNHSDFTFRTEKGIHSKSYVHLSLIK